jgi:ferric-dicitrate binding protein FerR (iron transport regulator)
VLPDGSKVWLNAVSSLRFPTSFTGKERRVELNGEGYFEIAKNVSMPFKVAIAPATNPGIASREPLEIEVLGTEFDLMTYADEDRQKVTLVSGSVKASLGNKQLVLQPNQQAFLDKRSYALNLTSISNLEETTAWKDGYFQFQDASIESIMRQAARWYDVEVIYDGKVNQQFIGKVRRQVNLSTLLKILEATGWVHFRIDGKKVTVSP